MIAARCRREYSFAKADTTGAVVIDVDEGSGDSDVEPETATLMVRTVHTSPCARMYVCMYACMHACMYVCMYVCTTLYVNEYVCVYLCMFVLAFVNTCSFDRMHSWTSASCPSLHSKAQRSVA
jgi:hypothetical protein